MRLNRARETNEPGQPLYGHDQEGVERERRRLELLQLEGLLDLLEGRPLLHEMAHRDQRRVELVQVASVLFDEVGLHTVV